MEKRKRLGRPPLAGPRRMTTAKLSDWDSEVFRQKVGILKCKKLPLVMRIYQDNPDFDVVFVTCEGWVTPDEPVTALDYRYDMEARPLVDLGLMTSSVTTVDRASESHQEIAETAFSDSRFLLDPILAHKAGGFYTHWLSLSSPIHVLKDCPDHAFLVVKPDPDGASRISLIAVRKTERSNNLGEKLVRGAFLEKETDAPPLWRVKVSARNNRGIRFYEKLGFRVSSVSTAFHVWTKRAL